VRRVLERSYPVKKNGSAPAAAELLEDLRAGLEERDPHLAVPRCRTFEYLLPPHLSLDRPVVLSQGARVSLEVQADHPPILTVDGQFEIALSEGDRVEVRASSHVSMFAHLQDRAYFYRTLMDRLRWKV